MGEEIQITYEEYEFYVVCKTCGVIDKVTLSEDEAVSPMPLEEDVAYEHYNETGHTVLRLNYSIAPADVREMLESDDVKNIDFERIGEWIKQSSSK